LSFWDTLQLPPNTFLALCTRHIYNQHALFLAAWVRTFETAPVAKAREMYFNYTIPYRKSQQDATVYQNFIIPYFK
jgi:hypothetical protein